MPSHPCPWTLGQLLALHAIAKTAGHHDLAALLLEHADQHYPEGEQS